MPMNFTSFHAGSVAVLVGLAILALVWRSIKLVMKIVVFFLVVLLGVGAWAAFEYHATGRLPFDAWGH